MVHRLPLAAFHSISQDLSCRLAVHRVPVVVLLLPPTAAAAHCAVIHGIVAWIDAYGIGANDVANAFGTSVGEQREGLVVPGRSVWAAFCLPAARFPCAWQV